MSTRAADGATCWWRSLLALLLLFAAVTAASAQSSPSAAMPPFPALTGPVVDEAHLLPADVLQQLSEKLAAYSQANGAQVVVVTLATLNGYPIEEYGYQLGRHWGIGQKGKDNGVLLIVDAGEHKMRIEVGYGLEGTLTDAQSFLIIHNVITPRFRKGDFAGGITAGTDAILSVLGGHPLAAPRQQQVQDRGGTGFLMFFILIFVFLPLLRAMLGRGGWGSSGRYGGGWLGWLLLGMLSGGGGGSRGGGLGGGSFGGGGGFGGFSGGGGSFGGGGASGSW